MANVAFDPVTHTYEEMQSVTRYLQILMDTSNFTVECRDRGSAVHVATHYLDEGDLDFETVDPSIIGYLRAYEKFLADTEIKWVAIEKPICDAQRRYAGTPDRISHDAVLDIKTGSPSPWHALQLAAYVSMLDNPFHYHRLALYLAEDETYSIREFPKSEYTRDLNVFLSCVNIGNWKRSH